MYSILIISFHIFSRVNHLYLKAVFTGVVKLLPAVTMHLSK